MKCKLLQLLEDSVFVSGEKLAERLDVSRVAVWKQIKSLQRLGYEIESVKNKGYRLVSRPDIPIPEEITTGLNTKIVGKEVYYFKTISSTNVFARELVEKGAKEGTIVISEVQTIGKGRKNRSWYSPQGGLWFSVILYPRIPPERGMLITMAASVAVSKSIKEITGLNATIKWPNDLLINGKKVCGILTVIDAEIDTINYSIIGIGINVNNDIKKELQETAISLKQAVGSPIFRVKFLRSVIKHLDKNYDDLVFRDYDSIRKLWLSQTDIVGRKIQVLDEEKIIEGTVSDVDNSGCLILETGHTKVRIVSGDVKYL